MLEYTILQHLIYILLLLKDILRTIWTSIWTPLSLTTTTPALCAAFSTGLLYLQNAEMCGTDQSTLIVNRANKFLILALNLDLEDTGYFVGSENDDQNISRVLKEVRIHFISLFVYILPTFKIDYITLHFRIHMSVLE